MATIADPFARACELSGKMGGIGYEAGVALRDLECLKEWIGNGKSRKSEAMKSLCESLHKRLTSIVEESK